MFAGVEAPSDSIPGNSASEAWDRRIEDLEKQSRRIAQDIEETASDVDSVLIPGIALDKRISDLNQRISELQAEFAKESSDLRAEYSASRLERLVWVVSTVIAVVLAIWGAVYTAYRKQKANIDDYIRKTSSTMVAEKSALGTSMAVLQLGLVGYEQYEKCLKDCTATDGNGDPVGISLRDEIPKTFLRFALDCAKFAKSAGGEHDEGYIIRDEEDLRTYRAVVDNNYLWYAAMHGDEYQGDRADAIRRAGKINEYAEELRHHSKGGKDVYLGWYDYRDTYAVVLIRLGNDEDYKRGKKITTEIGVDTTIPLETRKRITTRTNGYLRDGDGDPISIPQG